RHEHEIDFLLTICRAVDDPKFGTVRLDRRHHRRIVHPWALVNERLPGRAPAIVALRARVDTVLTWAAANSPRHGWARRHSRARAAANPKATEFNLPARNRPAFYTWRRGVRALQSLLLLLHEWWDCLCPQQRSSSPRNEETRSASSYDTARAVTEIRRSQ